MELGETQRPLEIEEKQDIISTMPEEIISNILSLLSLKEAAMTSILAKKWRYQWTTYFGLVNLDNSLDTFELGKKHIGFLRKCSIFISNLEKFISTLKHVMKSLTSPHLQGMRICLEMGCPNKIVEVFKFAAEKHVQILDLDFSYHFNSAGSFLISETIRNVVVLPSKNLEMESLRVLRLASVDVKGEVVEYILEHCPSLETLFIKYSKTLSRLIVSGEALQLKHLELVECNIVYFSISAENLITFKYFGGYGNFYFEYVPRLMEASFGGRYGSYLQSNLRVAAIFGLISQLSVLELEVHQWGMGILHNLPVFNNVEHLELQIPYRYGQELNNVVTLLGAFPSIRVLKMKFIRSSFRVEPEQPWQANLQCEFPNLEELEVTGYRKNPSQLELLTKIFERAPNLNKITVDSLPPVNAYRSPDVKARIRRLSHDYTSFLVDGLKPYVPPTVEWVVL